MTTSTDIEVIDNQPKQLVRASIFNLEPEAQIEFAARIATTLAKVIDKQGLYTNIQGRKYVKVEGWEVLGTFLGVLPKERFVNELSDGSYEAFVDLVRSSDGIIVGGASAICGIDEKRWSNADRYARRSMAITRAVGKAYRTSFSWIISLAGYAVTPAEEMPYGENQKEIYEATEAQKKLLKRFAVEAKAFKEDDPNEIKGKICSEISQAIMGTKMSELKSAIFGYVETPFRN